MVIKINRKSRNCTIGVCIAVAAIGLASSSSFGSEAVMSAKGANVITLDLQTRSALSDFHLKVSYDGETYHNCSVGLPRAWQLFYSISQAERDTAIVVSVVAGFSGGVEQFLFEQPGHYWFRWTLDYVNGDKPSVVDQEVVVSGASDADLSFIEGLAEPKLIRAMFGEDFFERQTGNAVEHYADPEVRAVAVIGRLLYATREGWVGDIMRVAGPRGDVRQAAEILLNLAKEIPESSYAPYAAYYAGCCYYGCCFEEAEEAVRSRNKEVEFINDLAQGKYRVAQLKQNPDTSKAYEAFSLAARRADDYLKPRVLYHHGTFRLFSFDLDESERLFDQAEQVVPGEGTIQKWVDKARRSVDSMRAELAKDKARLHGDEESESETPMP